MPTKHRSNAPTSKKALLAALNKTTAVLSKTAEDIGRIKGAVTEFQKSVLGDLHNIMRYLAAYKAGLLEVDARLRVVEEQCNIESPPIWGSDVEVEKDPSDEIAQEVKEAVKESLDAAAEAPEE